MDISSRQLRNKSTGTFHVLFRAVAVIGPAIRALSPRESGDRRPVDSGSHHGVSRFFSSLALLVTLSKTAASATSAASCTLAGQRHVFKSGDCAKPSTPLCSPLSASPNDALRLMPPPRPSSVLEPHLVSDPCMPEQIYPSYVRLFLGAPCKPPNSSSSALLLRHPQDCVVSSPPFCFRPVTVTAAWFCRLAQPPAIPHAFAECLPVARDNGPSSSRSAPTSP